MFPVGSTRLALAASCFLPATLLQIGTWTPKGSSTRPTGGAGGPTVSYRRAWGISVQRDDDAYLWARWLAPVYSVTVANIKTAMRLQVGVIWSGVCAGQDGGEQPYSTAAGKMGISADV